MEKNDGPHHYLIRAHYSNFRYVSAKSKEPVGGLWPRWRLLPLCFNTPVTSLCWSLWLAACYEVSDSRSDRSRVKLLEHMSNDHHAPPRAAAGTDGIAWERKNHSPDCRVEERHMTRVLKGIHISAVKDDWKRLKASLKWGLLDVWETVMKDFGY